MTTHPTLVALNWPVPDGIDIFDASDRQTWLTKLRPHDATCSAIGCLLGVHEYLTPFEYWALKSGKTSEDPEETPAMKRGRLLEDDALELVAEKRPEWKIVQPSLYFRDTAARIGGTPDAFVICPERGRGNLQVKTTSDMVFRKKWKDETGEVVLPLWIACQAILEAHLTGAEWTAVALMVIGNGLDVHIIDVPINRKLISRIYAAVADFWNRVEQDDPPPVDYERDGKIVSQLYADDDGGETDLSGNDRVIELLESRQNLKATEAAGTQAAKDRKVIDTEIICLLGNAARGRTADGRLIEAKTIRRGAYQVEASSYRQVKIKEISNGAGKRSGRGDRSQSAAGDAFGSAF